MKYNLSRLMKKAWALYRKTKSSFGSALKLAWAWLKVQASNAAKVKVAAESAGYAGKETHTWAGWQALGRMVAHESKAVFQVEVDDPTTRKGTRVQSYFTYEQTEPEPI